MTQQEIKEGNILIAEFMGYKYYHPHVDVDYSDCGGIWDRVEVFSKVPIEVNEYPEDNQYYFKKLPNPDYKSTQPKHWRNDLDEIPWDSLNSDNYITELKYDSDWNELIPVVEKIESIFDEHHGYFVVYINSNSCTIQGTHLRTDKVDMKNPVYFNECISNNKLESTWITVYKFIKCYNNKTK
jgi:hypothetical protein